MTRAKFTLRRYQRVGIARIWKRWGGRGLLADEMGLGKTVQALIGHQWHNEHPGPLVVVCPAYLKYHWESEVRKYTGLRAEILDGETPPMLVRAAPAYIVNYDILTPKKRKRRRGRRTDRTWVKVLRAMKPSTIVCDEAQYLKSTTALRTKAVNKLQKGVPHFLALSGTGAMENCPAELWPVLHMIDRRRWPTFYPFGMKFCAPRLTPWGWQFKGATNVEELNRILRKTVMVRRLAKDVLKELPELSSHVVEVELSNRKEYDEAERDLIKWLAKTNARKAKQAANAEQLVKWAYLRRCLADGKVKAVTDWVRDFLDSEHKLLVFGFHTTLLEALHRQFKKEGAVLVTGKVPAKTRSQLFTRFNDDPKCRVLFGNIDAGGTGWSCRATSTVVFCELMWNPAKHRQAMKRVHGLNRGVPGQPARAVFLTARNTIEGPMGAALQKKQEVQDAVLDGKKAGADMDLRDLMERTLLTKGKTR